jgi:DNA-binding transcriptional LysR family regulator
VHEETLVVVVAGDHRWARRRAVSSRDLRDEPYVTREAGSGTRAVVDEALSQASVNLVATLETASLQSVKRALISGGFSLLSPLAIEAEQRSGQLAALPLRDVELTRELRAVHDRHVPLTGVARRFWSWLQNNRELRRHRGPSQPVARQHGRSR